MDRRLKYDMISDLDLQLMVAERDQQAIEFIYKQNFNMVRSLIRKYNPEIDPQDIYHESMLVLLNVLYDRKLTCKISTFLYSVARNLLLKELRDSPIMDSLETVNVESEIEEFEKISDRRIKLNHAMKKLGDKCREIIEAFYLRSMKMEDIAIAMNYTNAENAKNQKYKCMKQLKRIINE